VEDERTDSELLLASGEESAAFGVLFRRHAEDLLRYFARRTLDPTAAADLTAETFAEAFRCRRSYREEGMEGVAWLYGVARHQLSRFFRVGRVEAMARQRLGMPERELPPEDYERIEELVDFAPLKAALKEALVGLPQSQRDALQLRVVNDLGYAEVARKLECSEGSARQRVSRGLRQLGLVLHERGLALAEAETE